MESGWNVWVWLVGVVAQVKSMDDNCGEWVECMGVASGSGCKEVHVYRFPHTTYPYSSCICFFCSSIPTFC